MKANKMLKQAACLALALLLMSPMLISPVQATEEDDLPEGIIGIENYIREPKYTIWPVRPVDPGHDNNLNGINRDSIRDKRVKGGDLTSLVSRLEEDTEQLIIRMEESDQDEEQGFWGTLGRGIKNVATFAGSMVVNAVRIAGDSVVNLAVATVNFISNPFAAPVPPTSTRP